MGGWTGYSFYSRPDLWSVEAAFPLLRKKVRQERLNLEVARKDEMTIYSRSFYFA